MQKKYHVTLSFAGEDRQYAENLANLLKSGGYSVFYDKYEPAELWGKNLYAHFSSVYKDQAEYCVMFLSEYYTQKLWTSHELQSAQARAFEDNRGYILPIRLDDTEVSGIPKTIGFLDARSMTIEQIYEILVKKLSDSTSQSIPTNISPSATGEIDHNEFVLLRSTNGTSHFIPYRDATWSSAEISLELLPESGEENSLLRSLRDNLSSGFTHTQETLAFALQEDAAWVRPHEVAKIASSSHAVWKVVLRKDEERRNYNIFNDIAFNNISPDQIAEMRARRILLDEKSFQNQTGFAGLTNDATLESFISGEFSSQHDSIIQVSESPIPHLYRSFGQTPGRFLKFARSAATLYLKLSNTVEDILLLDLKLRNPRELQIRFKGRRPQRYTNVEAFIFEVNGICPLSG